MVRFGFGLCFLTSVLALGQQTLGPGAQLDFGPLQDQEITVTKLPGGYATTPAFSVFLRTGDLGQDDLGEDVLLTGMNYYLEIQDDDQAKGSGFFHINDRVLVSPIFQDPLTGTPDPDWDGSGPVNFDDVVMSGEQPNDNSILAVRNGQNANLPRNGSGGGWDLGAVDGQVGGAGSGETHELASYVLGVSPSTPPGKYKLWTVSETGTGWDDGGTHEFDGHGKLTIHVVPEPRLTAMIGVLGLLSFAAYRRLSGRKGKD